MGQYYPFPNYRPYAKETSVKIRKAFDSGKRFVIVDAPTGFGKSATVIEFAREFKAPILTPTKLLQHQYANTPEFNLEYVIKGKSNYKCGLETHPDTTCDEAICCSDLTALENADDTPWADAIKNADKPARAIKLRCVSAEICPYYGLINKIGKVPGAVINYDLFFLLKKNPGDRREGIDMGEALVMDEAHQLIPKAKEIFGYTISNASAMKLLGQEGKRVVGEAPIAWLERVLGVAAAKASQETNRKKAAQLSTFISKLNKLMSLELADSSKFFIEDTSDAVEIKPLNMRYLKGLIFSPFKKILLLSATFPSNFCDLLGIKEDEVEYIRVPSTFPKENRPIFIIEGLPALNYQTELTKEHPSVKAMDAILAKHKDQKGIVHCSNYKFFNQLKKIYSRNSRFVWVERGEDKNKFLEQHSKSNKGTILVSPALLEGIDLKDDLARFQIMVKIPFPMLDDYTKQMMKIYNEYYNNAVAVNIVQAYGRAVRTPDDHASFYILDGAINRLLSNKTVFPKHFIEAVSKVSASKI